MQIPLNLRVTPLLENIVELVSSIVIEGDLVKVLPMASGKLTVLVPASKSPLSVITAIRELEEVRDVVPWESPEPVVILPTRLDAEVASMSLSPTDVIDVETNTPSVWDVIFSKPPPVFDRQHWADSGASDKFIYLPNCTQFKGANAEDYNSNAMYTQVMLAAYQAVCRNRKVDPLVRLQNGNERAVLTLKAFHGSQTHIEGERAAGLANSVLVDFCDGDMGNEFIVAVSLLGEQDFHSEPSRQTVLAKSELILAGKSSHMYNQRFMREFFDLLTINYAQDLDTIFGGSSIQAQGSVLSIFRGMVIDGFVLENNVEEFKARLWSGGLGPYEDFLGGLFKEVHCG